MPRFAANLTILFTEVPLLIATLIISIVAVSLYFVIRRIERRQAREQSV